MSKKGRSTISREFWVSIVRRVVAILDENCIRYHIDASSSLYVQGVEFEMDDLDVTVEWGSFEKVAEIFENYSPTEISLHYPPSFKFQMSSTIVHILSYRSASGIGESTDRLQVDFNGVTVWTKSIGYYQQHMGPEHRLLGPLHNYLQRGNSQDTT